MNKAGLHRYAILVALLILIVIALGALLTSEIRPLPGSGASTTVSAPGLEQLHRLGGYLVAVLTLGLAVWSSGLVAWLALALVVIESFSGGIPVVHALLAPVDFSLVVAVVILTSKTWQSESRPVENEWPPLVPLGMAMPVLVFLQIGLGAAFRHNDMGVIWHILNALVVLLVILVAGVFVVRQYPEHPSLRPAALTLLIVTGIQVLLGFSVYLVLIMSSDNNMALIVTGVIHVVNGALTLAASVALAMQMRRDLAVTNRSVTPT